MTLLNYFVDYWGRAAANNFYWWQLAALAMVIAFAALCVRPFLYRRYGLIVAGLVWWVLGFLIWLSAFAMALGGPILLAIMAPAFFIYYRDRKSRTQIQFGGLSNDDA